MSAQLSLFESQDVFSQLKVQEHELHGWYCMSFLSFNPRTVQAFEPWMKREAVFVRDLMRTELSLNTVRAMLAKLDRPYAYRHGDIFFDFALQQWRRRYDPEDVAIYLSANPSITEDAVAHLIRLLARFGCRQELARIHGLLLEMLAHGEPDTSG